MPWRNGGVIGQRNLPSITSAGGVWKLSEIESARRGLSWPTVFSSPADIDGLTLWLDAADSSTLFDATSGGSVVAANGAVARWQDKSGGGRHFTQATSGVRPVRRTAVKNGLDAVEFTNDWIAGTYTYTIGSIFVVWNHPTTVLNDTSPAIVSARTSSANKTASGSLSYTLMMPSASNVATDPNPGTSTYRLNGSTPAGAFTSFSTGVSARTSPDRWQYTSATFSAVAGSKPVVLGADTFSAARFMQNGHIGEVIAYSGTLAVAQVQLVENYLVNKWGLA